MDEFTTILARVQFAVTIGFHYLYPPLSIGIGLFLVVVEGLYLRTKDPLWRQVARFWTKIFALTFAIGVATGLVMEFEFGTNWATYSRFVGDVFGSALAAEGIFAFFLESGFLALLIVVLGIIPVPRFPLEIHMITPPVLSAGSLSRQMHDLARHGIPFGADRVPAPDQPWWRSLAGTGTRSWLDTGDVDAASALWCSSFAALTTNNTLLNKEVQKGLYDTLIHEASISVKDLPAAEQVIEIAFLLNAHHALRLASRFGSRVSVELHTALADDVERSVTYGRRLYAVCPEHFIVKVPLTPAGLLATRRLRSEGIPVNFTLGFSARQNLLAAALAAPSYVNVFLGRLNAYVADNHLGDGNNVGEKATLASQREVRTRTSDRIVPTLQIAASMRSGEQVVSLAGVDVHTMPIAAAQEALRSCVNLRDRTGDDPVVVLAPSSQGSGVDCLWRVGFAEQTLADSLELSPPETTEELLARCAAHGLGGIFPSFSPDEAQTLSNDGKIPKHARWARRITDGTCSVDGLMTAAALASFSVDQAALDNRIRRFL